MEGTLQVGRNHHFAVPSARGCFPEQKLGISAAPLWAPQSMGAPAHSSTSSHHRVEKLTSAKAVPGLQSHGDNSLSFLKLSELAGTEVW